MRKFNKNDEDKWIYETLRALFQKHGLIAHQLESYNYFMTILLEQILFENNTVNVTQKQSGHQHIFTIKKIAVDKPLVEEASGFVHSLLPEEARRRGISYVCDVLIDVLYEIHDENGNLTVRKLYREILFCKIPCMVRSRFCHLTSSPTPAVSECWYDEGGFFVIKGQERVINVQEKVRTNMPYVRSINKSKYLYSCQIRSWNEKKIRSTSTLTCYLFDEKGAGKRPRIKVALPFVDFHVSLPIVFRLIGVRSKEEMRQIIGMDNECNHFVQNVLKSPMLSKSDEELLTWIGEKGTKEKTIERRRRYVQHIFENEFLPHVGLDIDEETRHRKAQFLGYSVRKLLLVYIGKLEPDDRDDYANKRLETPGMLMGLLLRQHLRTFVKTTAFYLQKTVDGGKFVDVMNIMHAKRITAGFRYALSSGNWGVQKGTNSNQNGVSQILHRVSPVATLCLIRRVNTPMNREAKMHKPRLLHCSHMGIICNTETPEGNPCGLVKTLALSTYVRCGVSADPIIRLVSSIPQVCPVRPDESNSHWRILVNGYIFATTDQPELTFNQLRMLRQMQDIPFHVSLYYSEITHELRISSDSGGCVRPLYRVDNLHKLPRILEDGRRSTIHTWTLLLLEGVVEYVDKEEERMYNVAIRRSDLQRTDRFTHLEISPLLHSGLSTNLIPFFNHNQAPRNIYSTSQLRQAIGTPHTQWRDRLENFHALYYPQRPCVSTSIGTLLGFDEIASGQNPIVAICSLNFNQEDALIFSKSSLDMGMFRSTFCRTYKDQAKETGSERQEFGIPDFSSTMTMKHANYTGIVDPDGMRRPGDQVRKGDVLISKTFSRRSGNANGTYARDVSLVMQDNGIDEATVDSCMVSSTPDGKRYYRTKIRNVRIPDIGDKFASRHGQKGVIGLIVPREDLPFTESGITPDIIINSHCLSSRKTIGQLMESLLGKLGCCEGKIGDGTAFRDLRVDQIGDCLQSHGFQRHGEEVMIDGKTGKMMKAKIFMGVTFYQRLKHMSADKVHARSTGRNNYLTRGPVDGRSKGGGLRFGEMEVAAVETHGAAWLLKDRLMDSSDAFTTVVCNKCGMLAELFPPNVPNLQNVHGWCRNCQSSTYVRTVTIPYAFKLLIQELAAFHISCRIEVEDNPDQVHC